MAGLLMVSTAGTTTASALQYRRLRRLLHQHLSPMTTYHLHTLNETQCRLRKSTQALDGQGVGDLIFSMGGGVRQCYPHKANHACDGSRAALHEFWERFLCRTHTYFLLLILQYCTTHVRVHRSTFTIDSHFPITLLSPQTNKMSLIVCAFLR
jgi:hypothetical protein